LPIQERSEADDTVKRLTATNDQLNGEIRKLKAGYKSLQQQLDKLSEATAKFTEQQRAIEQLRAEKGELQQKIGDMEVILRNAEVAREAAERRLPDVAENSSPRGTIHW
jgi:predicted RNase H-like nuclease (RuvC/YqgF family)